MQPIYLYTLFNQRTGKPCCVGMLIKDEITIKEIYRPGSGKLLKEVEDNKSFVRNLLIAAHKKNIPIITSDFKLILQHFDIPISRKMHNIYDLHLPSIEPVSKRQDGETLNIILNSMAKYKPIAYQKLLANAAVVYEDLERTGLVYNYKKVKPLYSQKTYSGRSKTSGFNIQGLGDPSLIWPTNYSENDLLIHFDWICADIRAAALLSKDEKLMQSFVDSDPYTFLMNEINHGSEEKLTREESKLFLLKSINSMDFMSIALTDIYPGLGRWIREVRTNLEKDNGYIETLMGRKFYARTAKNKLAALNGAMQGTVAHFMQIVVRKIWRMLGVRLITEIHDSLVICYPPNDPNFPKVVDAVANIMLRPLGAEGPVFPLNVSVGKKWKKWRPYRTYRENGIYNVKKIASKDGKTPKKGQEKTTPQEATTNQE